MVNMLKQAEAVGILTEDKQSRDSLIGVQIVPHLRFRLVVLEFRFFWLSRFYQQIKRKSGAEHEWDMLCMFKHFKCSYCIL